MTTATAQAIKWTHGTLGRQPAGYFGASKRMAPRFTWKKARNTGRHIAASFAVSALLITRIGTISSFTSKNPKDGGAQIKDFGIRARSLAQG